MVLILDSINPLPVVQQPINIAVSVELSVQTEHTHSLYFSRRSTCQSVSEAPSLDKIHSQPVSQRSVRMLVSIRSRQSGQCTRTRCISNISVVNQPVSQYRGLLIWIQCTYLLYSSIQSVCQLVSSLMGLDSAHALPIHQ